MNALAAPLTPEYPRAVGRYVVYEPFARGGMASVHLGRLIGPVGFSRTFAVKRMHEQFARDPAFVAMFLDEARLVARISHPNVVPTLDVVALEDELLLVMEYVCGASLQELLDRCRLDTRLPPISVVVDIAIGMLHGLHAAHEATSADGGLLNIVHRDVTPHNVLIGVDGATRVVDFGVAKASNSAHKTRTGEVKGKLSYMAPEQLKGEPVTRVADVYSASVVLWEALTCERLFKGDTEGAVIYRVLNHEVAAPSLVRPDVPKALDAIVQRGLSVDPLERWETAKAMAEALERAVEPVARSVVGGWVTRTAREEVRKRQENLARVESYEIPSRPPTGHVQAQVHALPSPPTTVRPGARARSASAEGASTKSGTTGAARADTFQSGTTLGLGPLASAEEQTTPKTKAPLGHLQLGLIVAVIGIGIGIGLYFVLAPPPHPKPSSQVEARASALPAVTSSPVPQEPPSVSTTPGDPGTTASAESSSSVEPPTAPPMSSKPIRKRSKPVAPSRIVSPKGTGSDHLYKRD